MFDYSATVRVLVFCAPAKWRTAQRAVPTFGGYRQVVLDGFGADFEEFGDSQAAGRADVKSAPSRNGMGGNTYGGRSAVGR